MFPRATNWSIAEHSSPRVCGDVSLSDLAKNTDSEFSPRMRGCFLEYCACSCTISVLPAYAGMFPAPIDIISARGSSPRVCGDVSPRINDEQLEISFSPRMRGCFRKTIQINILQKVLPAYAGMFPRARFEREGCDSSPRVCGDVSKIRERTRSVTRFSPRMRGCFREYFLRGY